MELASFPALPAGAQVILGYADQAAAGTRALRSLQPSAPKTTFSPKFTAMAGPLFAPAESDAPPLPAFEVSIFGDAAAAPLVLINLNTALDPALGEPLACALVDSLVAASPSPPAFTVLSVLRLADDDGGGGPTVFAARVGGGASDERSAFAPLAPETHIDDAFLAPLLRYAQLAEVPTTLLACAGARFRRRDPTEDGTADAIAALGDAAVRVVHDPTLLAPADSTVPAAAPLLRVANWPTTAEQQLVDEFLTYL